MSTHPQSHDDWDGNSSGQQPTPDITQSANVRNVGSYGGQQPHSPPLNPAFPLLPHDETSSSSGEQQPTQLRPPPPNPLTPQSHSQEGGAGCSPVTPSLDPAFSQSGGERAGSNTGGQQSALLRPPPPSTATLQYPENVGAGGQQPTLLRQHPTNAGGISDNPSGGQQPGIRGDRSDPQQPTQTPSGATLNQRPVPNHDGNRRSNRIIRPPPRYNK